MSTTTNSRLINTSPDKLYHAFTNPSAIESWMAPGNKSGKVHSFDGTVGGGYVMEGRFTARFITLQPYKRIVESIHFDSDGPAYVGEMIMEIRLERQGTATLVTIVFTNIPLGVKPEDNKKGIEQSLDRLEDHLRS